uniref:Uncharacterized protein n=1 Tax=Panagrolaimus davidi TaxID=227884 RepID=A0A914PEA1_9BILA
MRSEVAKLREVSNPSRMLPVNVTRNDFLLYGIHEDDVFVVINLLLDLQIIRRKAENKYILYNELNDLRKRLPSCYYFNIMRMIQKKSAFIYVYRSFIIGQITLFTDLNNEIDTTLFNELIENGILEYTNIDCKMLDERVPDGNLYRTVTGAIFDNYHAQHFESAVNYAKHTIKKTIKDPNELEKIVSETSKKRVKYVFDSNAPALDMHKEIDIKFLPINDVISQLDFDITKLMSVVQVMPYLISPCEKKWSKETITKLVAIGSISLIQIGVGAGLVLFSAGVGTFIGKTMIKSGFNDTIFCVTGAIKGNCNDYLRQKIKSLVLDITMSGIGDKIKYDNGVPCVYTQDVALKRLLEVLVDGSSIAAKKLLLNITEIRVIAEKKEIVKKSISLLVHTIDIRIESILDNLFNKMDDVKETFATVLSQNGTKRDKFCTQIKQEYYEKLQTIMEKTTNPNVLASIALYTTGMNQIATDSCAKLISDLLQKSIILKINHSIESMTAFAKNTTDSEEVRQKSRFA